MRTLLVLVLFPATGFASEPVVKLPSEAEAAPGRLLKLTAETDGKVVRWAIASEEADLIPFPDGKTALFCSAKLGRFIVLAWTAAGDVPSEAARCVVVVKEPKPPVPPPPPVPPDPLVADLRTAFVVDAGSNKTADLKAVAALYRLMALECVKSEYATAGQLNSRYRAAIAAIVPPLGIVAVRQRASVEVVAAVGTDPDAPLTDLKRKTLAETFSRLATACDEVLK